MSMCRRVIQKQESFRRLVYQNFEYKIFEIGQSYAKEFHVKRFAGLIFMSDIKIKSIVFQGEKAKIYYSWSRDPEKELVTLGIGNVERDEDKIVINVDPNFDVFFTIIKNWSAFKFSFFDGIEGSFSGSGIKNFVSLKDVYHGSENFFSTEHFNLSLADKERRLKVEVCFDNMSQAIIVKGE